MESILLTHARRYPRMEPCDAVKLLYQSEFAGGHLIRDEAACKAFLLREYAATPQSGRISVLEDIGSGTFHRIEEFVAGRTEIHIPPCLAVKIEQSAAAVRRRMEHARYQDDIF